MLAIAYLLTGAIAAVAGVAVLAGPGWALVAAGALLMALGVLEARGATPAPATGDR